MIIIAVADFIMAVNEWGIGLFPYVALDTVNKVENMTNGFGRLLGFIWSYNPYLPIDELQLAASLWLLIYMGMHLAMVIRRLVSLFTGGGAS